MITLITGVPGTGKTAFLVAELEKIIATGRKVFVDNIPGLTLEHYRAGKITEWQKGTWLHIDRYKRLSPDIAMEQDEDDDDGNRNWEPNPEIVKDKDGKLRRITFDDSGRAVGSVPYESHKGALLVIDEAQRHFRPRPSGSVVPDHVAALEVHRHQGLDIWLVTQRPGLIDANVRALVGRHIALRSTSLGRWKYEWPEVGDIESKFSRDTAARSRYKLPKHVFKLYKSAEVHTMQKHTIPFMAKALVLLVPLFAILVTVSYKSVAAKTQPQPTHSIPAHVEAASAVPAAPVAVASDALPPGLEPYNPKKIDKHHPYENVQLSIVGRIRSETKDIFRFSAGTFTLSNRDLENAGYTLVALNDCSVKITYGSYEAFITCAGQPEPQPLAMAPAMPYSKP